MKNILIGMMLLSSISMFAQRSGMRKMGKQNAQIERMQSFTPEQRAVLESKRLTLSLDLNETQQKEIQELLLEKNSNNNMPRLDKESRENLSTEALFERATIRLDNQIAFNTKMKSILNKEQFSKWEQLILARKKHHHENKQQRQTGKHRKKR